MSGSLLTEQITGGTISDAGVSEAVANRLCGHETRRVYDGYRVVTGDDLREAAAKLNSATAVGKVPGNVAAAESGGPR
jgi:hypothetical protein